ncbi:MAG: glutamine amidotransferase [Parachlamydiaceae bacterium]
MKTAVAIRHVAFEDLGSWEKLLRKFYKIQYVDAVDSDITLLKNEDIDLLVVLGGPIGVYQEQEYPFIETEVSLLANRLNIDLPTLGLCLGSQLMAKALGAKVYPNHIKEIGWHTLNLTTNGQNNYVKYLSSEHTSMFHWHGDTFDLPKGAELLASTSNCQNQIFSWGKNGLAFQCHPEITAKHLEYWWIGHAAELGHSNLSVNHLRNESLKFSARLETQAARCLLAWIESIS